MEKQTFEKGDRVFDIRFGWGTVKEVLDTSYHNYPIMVFFDNIGNVITYASDGSFGAGMPQMLSFTEYTLQGFSQERPINYDDYIGKWGKFTDVSNNNDFVIGRLSSFKVSNDETYFATESGDAYNTFEPLTEEQIKVLGLCN